MPFACRCFPGPQCVCLPQVNARVRKDEADSGDGDVAFPKVLLLQSFSVPIWLTKFVSFAACCSSWSPSTGQQASLGMM